MSFFKFFRNILSKKIGKADIVGQGLILCAVQDEFGSTDGITFDMLKKTFENSLKERLEKVKISNVENVCAEMVKELIKNQSILTMGTV